MSVYGGGAEGLGHFHSIGRVERATIFDVFCFFLIGLFLGKTEGQRPVFFKLK